MGRFLPDQFRLHERQSKRVAVSGFLAIALATTSVLTPLPIDYFSSTAQAQQLQQRDPNAQLLLKADQLVYDNDAEIVTARGNVQLDYDGYNVVADRVSYNQKTRRVKAFGNVEILEPDGNRIYAQEIDLTDDFGEGFVNALRVETPDNTRFAAESAERFEGQKTVFNHGVYTACEPCKDKPNKPPIWQVKAQTVILDGVEKTVTYRNARFELFGLPIAYLPYFSHADPSVKRKSGFLIPTAGYSDEKGFWYRQSYFWATGDSHDLTVSATGFTKQGVMGELAWRHQLENGFYTISAAGIEQQSPSEFSNAPDNVEVERGMIASSGNFDINPRWNFGWNVLAQSDSNFSRTYRIKDYTARNFTNEVYLRGLHNKSYFDLSARQYLVQNDTVVGTGSAFDFEGEQPIVAPVLDYNWVKNSDRFGGEFSLDVNLASISRDTVDLLDPHLLTPLAGSDVKTLGPEGTSTRVSADLGWKTKLTTEGGLSFTPSLSMRGDWTSTDISGVVAQSDAPGRTIASGSNTRFMPTAGLEMSYPILARTAYSSHVIEPVAQIFARPDLGFDEVLPNEDAQSLVFDATTLFERDKFSGYDLIESGTRANVGIRYAGQFNNGLSLNGLIGQSFHLAGRNPYARTDDLANVGESSGLENDSSDIVAALGLTTTGGLSFNTQARFDNRDFEVQRADASVVYYSPDLVLAGNYTYIAPQPDYGFSEKRQQVGLGGNVKLAEHWRATFAAQYDIESDVIVSDSIGLTYHDECFTFALSFNETRSRAATTDSERNITFRVGLRTIGDFDGTISTENLEDFISGGRF